ncbi:hypothetical protein [Nocardia rhizosphaerae]|uniref:Secreted protein n=1 Tax=Nocardia rhizosphaerae TaxID=1691571 RepID=A0ABV8L241_9NOCA
MSIAHIIQVFILAGVLFGVTAVFVGLVRADLRANPPMAVVRNDTPADEEDDGDDPGAEWDRARDRWIDREIGAA